MEHLSQFYNNLKQKNIYCLDNFNIEIIYNLAYIIKFNIILQAKQYKIHHTHTGIKKKALAMMTSYIVLQPV